MKNAGFEQITSSTTITGLESLEVGLGFLDFYEDLGELKRLGKKGRYHWGYLRRYFLI